MRRRSRPAILALATVLAPMAGCSGAAREGAEPVRVLAAASLADAFEELAARFPTVPGGVAVELHFAASSSLREQILAGAPADVFASANQANMSQLVEAGAAVDPVDFVANRLQIAVPPGNAAGVAGLTSFADPELLLGLCAEEVPCGQLARQALSGAGITPSIDTDEPDVASLLTKVREGELDAGIVYRSDVLAAAGAVVGIDIPPEANVTTTYPITVLAGAPNRAGGDAFTAFVLSEEGRAVLADHGFELL